DVKDAVMRPVFNKEKAARSEAIQQRRRGETCDVILNEDRRNENGKPRTPQRSAAAEEVGVGLGHHYGGLVVKSGWGCRGRESEFGEVVGVCDNVAIQWYIMLCEKLLNQTIADSSPA
ncbi:hypothetical protein Tco_1138891, partial [Tanacetum coccineum]